MFEFGRRVALAMLSPSLHQVLQAVHGIGMGAGENCAAGVNQEGRGRSGHFPCCGDGASDVGEDCSVSEAMLLAEAGSSTTKIG